MHDASRGILKQLIGPCGSTGVKPEANWPDRESRVICGSFLVQYWQVTWFEVSVFKHVMQQVFTVAKQNQAAGRNQEAEKLFRQVIEFDPKHYPSLHALGVLSLKTGRIDAAIDFFGHAIASQPNEPESHHLLGHA